MSNKLLQHALCPAKQLRTMQNVAIPFSRLEHSLQIQFLALTVFSSSPKGLREYPSPFQLVRPMAR